MTGQITGQTTVYRYKFHPEKLQIWQSWAAKINCKIVHTQNVSWINDSNYRNLMTSDVVDPPPLVTTTVPLVSPAGTGNVM